MSYHFKSIFSLLPNKLLNYIFDENIFNRKSKKESENTNERRKE